MMLNKLRIALAATLLALAAVSAADSALAQGWATLLLPYIEQENLGRMMGAAVLCAQKTTDQGAPLSRQRDARQAPIDAEFQRTDG